MLRPRDPEGRRAVTVRRPDPVAVVSSLLLTLCAAGLLAGGVLAVYDWTTPGAEMPLFFGVLATFVAALGIEVLAATARRLRSAR